MRIDNLSYSNSQTQGAARRAWLQQHSPEHLEQARDLILTGLHRRPYSVTPNVVVLGAGFCTEIPLLELVKGSEEVILADLDKSAMLQAGSEIKDPRLHRKIEVIQVDLSGRLSSKLRRLINGQRWSELIRHGKEAFFNAAAACLEECEVPDPPPVSDFVNGEFGLVISSFVLSQLFSYPLLDLLDHVQQVAPDLLVEQERHRRYQDAVQNFRMRVINAHLHLLRRIVDQGGLVVLLSDIRGFAFEVTGTDHDASHRRAIPLVPRTMPEQVREHFEMLEERNWEWITDLPTTDRIGRGYEVTGYLLCGK